MSRFCKVLVATLLVVPAVAQAQRPANSMRTRSAMLYLDRGDKNTADRAKLYGLAMENALEAVKSEPNNSKSWFVLGQVYAHTGDAVGADSAFTKAETMWPEYAKETEQERLLAYVAAFNAGVTAIQKNDVVNAVKNLEAAATVYKKKPTAALNLGNLYARANDPERAAGAYRRALEVMRGPERKTLNAADEKQWAQWEEAAAFNLAQILATSDHNEEAAAAYEDYLKRNPNNITAKSNLAIVYNRLKKPELAQKIYADLLASDLPDDEYFAVGVGLFKGNQYPAAADAFRKAVAKNAAFRDAYYNLAQALYSQLSDLEEARGKVKVTEQKTFDAKMTPLYTDLISVSEKLRALDPNNRNVLALLARGYRGMADVVDAKVAMDWKKKTLEVMTAHQDLPYEVTDVSIAPVTPAAAAAAGAAATGSEVKVTGNIVNLKGAEGKPVTLKLSFLGKDGAVLGTQDVTVTAPKLEDQVAFSATFKSASPIGGWSYVVAK